MNDKEIEEKLEKISEKGKKQRGTVKSKHNGFYVALYSCVGIMLALAVIIGYNNFSTPKTPSGDEVSNPTAGPNLTASNDGNTGNKNIGGYIAPNVFPDIDDSGNLTHTDIPPSNNDDWLVINQPSEPPVTTQQTGQPNDTDGQLATAQNEGDDGEGDDGDGDAVPVSGTSDMPVAGLNPGSSPLENDFTSEEIAGEGNEEQNVSGGESEGYVEVNSNGTNALTPSSTFTAFTETDKMDWPVFGAIVWEYSIDRSIYDQTLEKYHINDNICIAAPLGTEVSAAAAGVVKEITVTREKGKMVVIEHGNGWFTTYSQLDSNVLVKAGDVVDKGQAIGAVGMPSAYSSALEPHLSFTVLHNDSTVNPNNILMAR